MNNLLIFLPMKAWQWLKFTSAIKTQVLLTSSLLNCMIPNAELAKTGFQVFYK